MFIGKLAAGILSLLIALNPFGIAMLENTENTGILVMYNGIEMMYDPRQETLDEFVSELKYSGDSEAVDAFFDIRIKDRELEYYREQCGSSLDVNLAKSLITHAINRNENTVNVFGNAIFPKVTLEELKANSGQICTFSTAVFSNEKALYEAMEICEKINGSIIMPAESMLLEDITGGCISETEGESCGMGADCGTKSCCSYCVIKNALFCALLIRLAENEDYDVLEEEVGKMNGYCGLYINNTSKYPLGIISEVVDGSVIIILMGEIRRAFEEDKETEQLRETKPTPKSFPVIRSSRIKVS